MTAKTVSRRSFLKNTTFAGAAAAGTLAAPAVLAQAPITLKMQSSWPASDIFQEMAQQYVDRVHEMSNNRIKIDLLPAGAVVGAFQVMDDLKDIYQKDSQSGKQQFIDLRNARISLPYIYVMDNLPRTNPVRKILSGKKFSETEFRQATKLVLQSRGIDKAYSEARVYMLKAIEQLEVYGDNKYAICLRNLVETVVNN